MIEDKIFWDIETLPTTDEALIADITANISPPANMKKPETIQRWREEEMPAAIEEAIKKTALDGGLGRLASICWAKADGEVVGAHTADENGWSEDAERNLIAGFFAEADAFYEEVAGAVLTGHNIINFDLRWLWKRAIVLGITVPHWWPLNARAWSPDVADTMTMWQGATGFISQDRLGKILGLGGKGPIDGSQVADLWDAGEYDRVLSYNADDVAKARRMWARITQHPDPIEPVVSAPALVEEKPAEVEKAAKFFSNDDEELAEEGTNDDRGIPEPEVGTNDDPGITEPMAEVAIAATVEEKPKSRGRVIPAFLKERGLAA